MPKNRDLQSDQATKQVISEKQVWAWLDDVYDPEIPVLSILDLGIVRKLRQDKRTKEWVLSVTPTYSGCPANDAIAAEIKRVLSAHQVKPLRIEESISPPWSSDWISERGRRRLRAYGIAPPRRLGHRANTIPARNTHRDIPCPRCASTNTIKLSHFGSTPCKAHYKCRECLEPFDYFKCI